MKLGLIYFVQQDTTYAVKIGYTANEDSLMERIDCLQTASPYKLRLVFAVEGSMDTEIGFHARFAKDRLMGEWFRPSEEMAKCIADQRACAARIVQV